MKRSFVLLAVLSPLTLFAAAPQTPFELRDGDRLVFLGDTLIEREQEYGYIELMMTLRFPDRNVTFRNLGWSADTPEGQSRASFDWVKGPTEWLRQLVEQIKQTQPSVVVLGYGMANSFDGEAGLEKFTASYNKLIDAILALNKETRFILLSPIRHEWNTAGSPQDTQMLLDSRRRHNQQLELYARASQQIAEKRGFVFVNLFEKVVVDEPTLGARSGSPPRYTDNGIHLNPQGYAHLADVIASELGWKLADYRLVWRHEELRQAIIKKNELFFHRWRPENSTYLFLFRKHEQGQNAKEIPKFDPLIQAEEEKIAKLRRQAPSREANPPSISGAPIKPAQTPITQHPATPFRPQPLPLFQTNTNIEVSLWAENPLLAKPIAMNFDARGRLWVASSSVYPQIMPGQEEDDKILVLEDTNGDGKADKTTVFADGLLIPTGVEPGDGGCYVGQSTKLLHFKDTDRDGIADHKRIVLSAFGTEDTHHILHTLRWGYDGQLYMNQSIYIHTHAETPHGVVRLNSGGILNFRPDTLELGVHMKGLVNSWGHVYDRFGQSFATDGASSAEAGQGGIFYVIPQGMYFTYAGARRIFHSASPGSYPKFCGLEIVESEHFPPDWQGNFITCDFRANRVVRFGVDEQGAGYVTRQMPDVLRTTNVTFRPIDVKLGPDGAIYIADWSNPIIQHGEVDFRDPRRDREHGRIWRVSYKDGKKVEKPELVKASNTELLNQLLSASGYNARQARRVLLERAHGDRVASEGVKTDLLKWKDQIAKKKDLAFRETASLEAVWMMQALDLVNQVNFASVQELLKAQSANVRAAATRVVGAWAGNTPGVPSLAKPRRDPEKALEILEPLVQDDHPRVRLEALRALARIPTPRAAELALSVLEKPMDSFLDYALWLTINDLAEPWIAAAESGVWKVEGREKQLEFGLKAIEPALASRLLSKVLAGKTIPHDGAGGAIELIGQAGGASQLRQLFDQVLQGGLDESAAVRALSALAEAARLRNAKPGGDLSTVGQLLERQGEHISAAAARLAGTWKLTVATPALLRLAGDSSASTNVRSAAFDGLREVGGREAVTGLRALAGKDHDGFTRQHAAMALAGSDLNGSVTHVLEVLNAVAAEDDALALWRSLLSVKGAAPLLARSLTQSALPEIAARAGIRVAREGGRNEPDLVLALNRAGSITDETHALTDEEIHRIAYDVTRGDPARGELVYRRKDLGCVICHAIGGAGGKVGPDMTSLGASAVTDYIVESVLVPNRKVKENFHSIQVATKDGQDLSGILVRENTEELVLRDATNKEISIPKKNIESQRIGGSLMPSGLVDILIPGERLDLFGFLTQLGKPGPFDATKGNVARVWKVRAGTSNLEQFGAESILKSDLNASQWRTVYSTVGGKLLKEDLDAEIKPLEHRGVVAVYAAAQLQLSRDANLKLMLDAPATAAIWIDGKPVNAGNEISAPLSGGTHTIIIKLDARNLPPQIRAEASEGTFSVN